MARTPHRALLAALLPPIALLCGAGFEDPVAERERLIGRLERALAGARAARASRAALPAAPDPAPDPAPAAPPQAAATPAARPPAPHPVPARHPVPAPQHHHTAAPPLLGAPPAGTGLTVQSTGATRRDEVPGAVVTAPMRVLNGTGRAVDAVEELELPPGWSALTPFPQAFRLEPGAEDLRIVSFEVGRTTGAGQQPVRYTVRTAEGGLRVTETLTVNVPAVSGLAVSLDDQPDLVLAGETYRVRFSVLNQGNTTRTIRLRARTSPRFPVELAPQSVTLAPGQSQRVNAFVRSSFKLPGRASYNLTVEAVGEGGAPETSATSIVAIIPRTSAGASARVLVPSQLRLILTQEDHDGDLQTELAGAGPFDETRRHEVGYLLRFPNAQPSSILGLIDEYRVDYAGRVASASGGDRVFELTQLTELARYGRGAQATVVPGRLGVHVFGLKTRFEDDPLVEAGQQLRYTVNDRLTVRGSHLTKQRTRTGPDADVVSVDLIGRPARDARAEAEYALSFDDARAGSPADQAYHVEYQGRSGATDYRLDVQHAGSGFLGFLRDVDTRNLAIGRRLRPGLTGTFGYRYFRNNLDLLPELVTATREEQFRAALSATPHPRTNVSVDASDFTRRDELAPAEFDFREDAVGVRVNHAFKTVTIAGGAERGTLDDHLTGRRADFGRYTAFGTWTPDPRYQLRVNHAVGPGPFSGSLLKTRQLGGAITARPWPRLYLSADVVTSQTDQQQGGRRRLTQYLSTVGYDLPNAQSLTARARHLSPDEGRAESSYLLVYVAPFDTEGARRTTIAELSGRVYDAGKPDHPGVKDVIVVAGTALATTDAGGRYAFPALDPGLLPVRIERTSLGPDLITTAPLPVGVELLAGHRTRLDVGVVRSARLTGRVVLTPMSAGPSKTTTGAAPDAALNDTPVGSVLVELRGERELLRRLTGPDGRFEFEEVRPGAWALSAHEDTLPPDHEVTAGAGPITLEPGARESRELRVEPRFKNMQILDEGDLMLKIKF